MNRKKITFLLLIVLTAGRLFAQKVEYKSNIISIDGKATATVVKIKDKANFGLTSTYELQNMAGQKLVIATVATDFEPSRSDNTEYYYRFTFLTHGQTGIFSLSKFGPEKSFAKMIGESGMVVNDQLDEAKVNEFIALKSKNPKVKITYNLVVRSRAMVVTIKENQIYQGLELIGRFKDVTTRQAYDTYEFSLPEGLVIATASFTGGNSAKNCILTTNKDGYTQTVDLSRNGVFGNMIAKSDGVDRNQEILKVIARWLVEKDYL